MIYVLNFNHQHQKKDFFGRLFLIKQTFTNNKWVGFFLNKGTILRIIK
jgi:hypothetical protein